MFNRLVLLACVILPGISWGDTGPQPTLVSLYQDVMRGGEKSEFGVPVFVSSNVQDDLLSAEVYGLVEHSFKEVADGLGNYVNWCQFMPLNLNIKSCTWQNHDNQPQLTFYAGRKFYEEPDDVYQLHYNYQVTNQRDDYVQIVLGADKGPMGTSDYRIVVDAIPVGDSIDGRTFMRINSSYRSGLISQLATNIYLATLGSDKVGFSVVGETTAGEPIYVDGIKGVVERNAMRYYLALVAFLDTSNLPPDERFEQRIRTWFDMTETYALQLHELEQDEYLEAKRKERSNQVKLQQQLDSIDDVAGIVQ